jgi:hypothetical protein
MLYLLGAWFLPQGFVADDAETTGFQSERPVFSCGDFSDGFVQDC